MIEKLNKTFNNGNVLDEIDLNPMSAKVDEIIDSINDGTGNFNSLPVYYIDNNHKVVVTKYTYQEGDKAYIVRHKRSRFGHIQSDAATGEENPRYTERGTIRLRKFDLEITEGESLHGNMIIKPVGYATFKSYMDYRELQKQGGANMNDYPDLNCKCEIIIERDGNVLISGIRFRATPVYHYSPDGTRSILEYSTSVW